MEAERVFEGWSPNFVEAVACAMSENVYSAALAWLLSSVDLPPEARRTILLALTPDLPPETAIRHAEREWRDVDILVHVAVGDATGVVAIENKIKAIEHSRQLAKYDRALAEGNKSARAKVFLTLLGTEPVSGTEWRPATYAGLLGGLRRACDLAPKHRYLLDFTDAVTRLVTAVDLVTSDPTYARVALGQENRGAAPGFVNYVSHGGLKNTLGQAWLAALARRAVGQEPSVWSIKASETRGSPLVNVERVVAVGGVDVNIGLQLQNWRMQAFAEPHPYGEVKLASLEQRTAVDACIDSIRLTLALPAVQRTATTGGEGDEALKGRYHRGIRLPATVEEFDAAGWADAMARVLPALERVGTSDEDATP